MTARLAALLGVALLLAGCFGSAPPVPRERYYRLAPPPAATAVGPLMGSRVAVAPFAADGLLRDRALVFADAGPAGALMQRDYEFWVDAPPRLVQEELVAYLRRSRPGVEVVTPELRLPSEFEIVGKLRRFEERAESVAVGMELGLIEVDGDRLLLIGDYDAELPLEGGSADVDAAVATLNTAVGQIFGRFLADAERTLAAEGLAAMPLH